MVQNTGDLAEQSTDPLGTLGDLDVQQLLDGQGEALLVGHHGDIVQTVEVGQRLQVCLVLDQLLSTTVQQTDVGICADNLLSVQLQNQTQHTVGGWVLRAEVDGVMSDLALLRGVGLVVGRVEEHRVGVDGRAEVGVDRNEAGGIGVLDRLSEAPGGRGGESTVLGARGGGNARLRTKADALGAIGGETGKGRCHDCCMLEIRSGGSEDRGGEEWRVGWVVVVVGGGGPVSAALPHTIELGVVTVMR